VSFCCRGSSTEQVVVGFRLIIASAAADARSARWRFASNLTAGTHHTIQLDSGPRDRYLETHL
jgi:hypothetical protein